MPVDPSLSASTTSTVSLSTSLASAPFSLADTLTVHPRKWEYVNLTDLLGDTPYNLTIINGQVITVTSAGIFSVKNLAQSPPY